MGGEGGLYPRTQSIEGRSGRLSGREEWGRRIWRESQGRRRMGWDQREAEQGSGGSEEERRLEAREEPP